MTPTSPGRKPRVVHVSSAHRWTDNRIHYREAASLAEAGYDVTLVAVEHKIDAPLTGVRVIQLRERPRLQRATWGSALAVLAGLRTRAKVFHLHDPELVWAVLPLRLVGRIVIYDAHEDVPNQVLNRAYATAISRLPLSLAARLVVRLATHSNHVVAATETIASRFPPQKVTVVHNYPRLRVSDVEQLSADSERAPRIAYLGAISPERGSREMVDALASTEMPPGWRAVFAGAAEGLPDLTTRRGWDRVDYQGVLPPDKARDLLQNCRVGLVVLQRSQAYVDSLPTKLFEYFAAGIPVVASDFPLWRRLILDPDCGQVVDETSPDAIARAIRRYHEEPDLLREHGRNAAQAARERFNWQQEERVLIDVYAELSIADG